MAFEVDNILIKVTLLTYLINILLGKYIDYSLGKARSSHASNINMKKKSLFIKKLIN